MNNDRLISPRVACLLFAGAFGFYLLGMSPSVSVGDAGEFITAAGTMGVPHAPGYPTYVVTAHAFQRLIPWANPAYRVNLFSTFAAALSVAGIFLVARLAGLGTTAALSSALLFLFSRAPTLSGRGSEVFALHALFLVAVIAAAMERRLILMALIWGVGMGNHQTLLFVIPGLLMYCRASRQWPSMRQGLWMATAAAVGLGTYGFIYMRALRRPFLDVGNGSSLEKLWRIFTRADYGSLTLALGTAPERSVANSARHLARFTTGMAAQVTWVGLLAIAAGVWLWFRKDPARGRLLFVNFLCLGPFFFWLGNLPFDVQSTGLLDRFYIAPLVCAVLLAGMLVESVHQRWPIAAYILALSPLALAFRHAAASDLRHEFRAYAYGRNNLRSSPPHALFIMDGGDDTFYTLAYLTQVEGRRPDLELHDRGGVVFPHLYGGDFRALSHEEKEIRRQAIEKTVAESGRTIVYSTMNPDLLKGVRLEPDGLLYQAAGRGSAVAPGSGALDAKGWPFYDLRDVAPWESSSLREIGDYRMRALVPFYAYQSAIELFAAGEREEARKKLLSANAVGQDVLWLQPNSGYALTLWGYQNVIQGRYDEARRDYALLLHLHPNDSAAWINLGAVAEHENHLDEAIAHYQKAIALNPTSAQAHFNLAVCYWKQRQWTSVERELSTTLQLDPQYPGATNYLAHVRAKLGTP